MRIHVKTKYQITDFGLVLLDDEWFEWYGDIDYCKGASGAQNAIADSQQNFMNSLQSDYGTAFSGQQGILNNLSQTLGTTVANGPSQFGFSPAETNALNTQATTGTAQQYQNAKQAAGDAAAATGGGNTVLPNAAANQQQTAIAESGAQQESNQLLGVQQAGWQQGNKNYNNALTGLIDVSNQYNPSQYAGVANTAGSSAMTSADTVASANAASSPWSAIGGIVGGVAGSFLGPLGTAVGSKLGSSIGGAASGAGAGATDAEAAGQQDDYSGDD